MTSRILLSGGCVLTLGAKTPNFTQADVLIEDGMVAEVGSGLRARDAERVDATDTVVMPGFVDTHRHAWTSLFRNIGDDTWSAEAPIPASAGDHYQPDDVYAATLIGLLGAAEAGITTVVDWSPLRPDGGLADAALRAHADSGLRTVFVHAGHHRTQSAEADGPATPEVVARLAGEAGPSTRIALGIRRDRAGRSRRGRRRMGAWRGSSGFASTRTSGGAPRVARSPRSGGGGSWAKTSRSSTARTSTTRTSTRSRSSRASVSFVPSSEVPSGIGKLPLIQQLIDRDIRPGLGVDDGCVTPGDMFAQMRAADSMQHATVFDRKLAGKAGVPRLMSTRDAIRYATVDGARVAGLRGVTGSLEPGMRADVIVLRTDRPNVFPINDPIGAVVWGMDTSNVDWVFVDGRVVMRGGVLEADVQRARSLATTALERVGAASGLIVGAAPGR